MWSFLKPKLTTSELAAALFYRTVQDRTGAVLPDAAAHLAECKATTLDANDLRFELLVLATCVVDFLLSLAASPRHRGHVIIRNVEPLSDQQVFQVLGEYVQGMKKLGNLMGRSFTETWQKRLGAYSRGMNALFANPEQYSSDNELTRSFAAFCNVEKPHSGFLVSCMFEVMFIIEATTSVLRRVKVRGEQPLSRGTQLAEESADTTRYGSFEDRQ